MDNCTSDSLSDVSQINMPPGISEKSSISIIKTDQFCYLLQNLLYTNNINEFARSTLLEFAVMNNIRFAEPAKPRRKSTGIPARDKRKNFAGGIKFCKRIGCGCLEEIARPGKYEKVLAKDGDIINVTINGITTQEAMDIECPCIDRKFRNLVVPALENENNTEKEKDVGTEEPEEEQEHSEYCEGGLPYIKKALRKENITESSTPEESPNDNIPEIGEDEEPQIEILEEGNIDDDYNDEYCEYTIGQMKKNLCVTTNEDLLFILEMYKLGANNDMCVKYGKDYVERHAPFKLKNVGPSRMKYIFHDAHVDYVKGKSSRIFYKYYYDDEMRLKVYERMKTVIMKEDSNEMDTNSD